MHWHILEDCVHRIALTLVLVNLFAPHSPQGVVLGSSALTPRHEGNSLLWRVPRQKRQAPFDQLIQNAFQLVRPIFSSARTLAKGVAITQPGSGGTGGTLAMDNKEPREQTRLTSAHLREIDILGLGGGDPNELLVLNDDDGGGGGMLPGPAICQGNSRICKFIACTAHNFKHDQNFANLQLATQLLGDKKLRRTVGANAGAINDVCREQGMSGAQCTLFTRAFQLIDRFMSTVEEKEEQQKQLAQQQNDENANSVKISSEEEGMGRKWAAEENGMMMQMLALPGHDVLLNMSKQLQQKALTMTTSTTPMTGSSSSSSSKNGTANGTAAAAANHLVPMDDDANTNKPNVPSSPPLSSHGGGGGSRTWSSRNDQQQQQPVVHFAQLLDADGDGANANNKNRRRMVGIVEGINDNNNLVDQFRNNYYMMRLQPPKSAPRAFIENRNAITAVKQPTTNKEQQQQLARPKSKQLRAIFYSTTTTGTEPASEVALPLARATAFPMPTAPVMPAPARQKPLLLSTIPEAEEFNDEDAAIEELLLEDNNNALSRWRRRRKKRYAGDHQTAPDYYDDLTTSSSTAQQKQQQQRLNRMPLLSQRQKQQSHENNNNQTDNNNDNENWILEEQEEGDLVLDDDDDDAIEDGNGRRSSERARGRGGKGQQRHQHQQEYLVENCLQYLVG